MRTIKIELVSEFDYGEKTREYSNACLWMKSDFHYSNNCDPECKAAEVVK